MLKLAIFGTVAYVGYRYWKTSQSSAHGPELRLAGGPLSANATLQHTDELPPRG
jgi:hypothetical protein